MLFTLYINDLKGAESVSSVRLRGCHTKIFLAVNKDLADITRWCCINSLLINLDKTKPLFVGIPQLLRSLPPLPPVMLLGEEIKPVPFTRDLGVTIDSYLDYNKHITELASSCIFRLSHINRIKHLLDQKTLISLINAFVFTKLFYCSTYCMEQHFQAELEQAPVSPELCL